MRRKRWSTAALPGFYRDILNEWNKIYSSPPDTDLACRAEPLWQNRFINLRSLSKLQCIWSNKGIWRINDVLKNGIPLNPDEFYRKYQIRHSQKLFTKLYNYIPAEFLNGIIPVQKPNKSMGLFIKNVRGQSVDLEQLSTKDLYKTLMCKKDHISSAQRKWCNIFYNEEEIQLAGRWVFWFNLPYKTTREVKYQSFQYRILQRILPCNEYLAQIRVLPSATCSFCTEMDDLFHFMYGCQKTKEFWDSLAAWLRHHSNAVRFPYNILEYELLFGVYGNSVKEHRLNYILLLARFYIYREKIYNDNNLDVYRFLVELKNALVVERWACIKEGSFTNKFKNRWELFFEEL